MKNKTTVTLILALFAMGMFVGQLIAAPKHPREQMQVDLTKVCVVLAKLAENAYTTKPPQPRQVALYQAVYNDIAPSIQNKNSEGYVYATKLFDRLKQGVIKSRANSQQLVDIHGASIVSETLGNQPIIMSSIDTTQSHMPVPPGFNHKEITWLQALFQKGITFDHIEAMAEANGIEVKKEDILAVESAQLLDAAKQNAALEALTLKKMTELLTVDQQTIPQTITDQIEKIQQDIDQIKELDNQNIQNDLN